MQACVDQLGNLVGRGRVPDNRPNSIAETDRKQDRQPEPVKQLSSNNEQQDCAAKNCGARKYEPIGGQLQEPASAGAF